jgi:hypothetical protein
MAAPIHGRERSANRRAKNAQEIRVLFRKDRNEFEVLNPPSKGEVDDGKLIAWAGSSQNVSQCEKTLIRPADFGAIENARDCAFSHSSSAVGPLKTLG